MYDDVTVPASPMIQHLVLQQAARMTGMDGPRWPSEQTLNCFYDLSVSPPTYDIISFLCRAEQQRVESGKHGIEVTLLPGPASGFRRDNLWPFTVAERVTVRDRVAVPLCRLLPSCVRVETASERPAAAAGVGFGKPMYGLAEFVTAYRAGVRPLRARRLARDPELVTITLREAEHWPARNSNIAAWIAAADEIKRRGYRVVFVRDTSRFSDPVPGFDICPEASVDIARRAELYAAAAVNLGVSNGPLWMALAMDAPVLMLRPTLERSLSVFGAAFYAHCGVPSRGQLPGAPAWHRLAWSDDDTASEIVTAFDEFVSAQTDAR
jgi:hypothetical protein